jgi:hypothetical protein
MDEITVRCSGSISDISKMSVKRMINGNVRVKVYINDYGVENLLIQAELFQEQAAEFVQALTECLDS